MSMVALHIRKQDSPIKGKDDRLHMRKNGLQKSYLKYKDTEK